MEDYEFRIFPPARLYSPPDGAQVFVRLKSAKETGLAKILPADSETSTIACGCSDDAAGIDANDDEAHSPTQGTSHPAAAAAVREATGSAMPRLPPGVTLEGRRRVQYADGGTAYVRPARFTPVYTGEPSVILCSDTKSFRKLCRTQVQQGDSVIDIGASYGASTQVIFEQCGNVLGLDVSKEAVADASMRYPEVRFEIMDVLAEPQRLQVVLRERRPNKVFVDIGGNRELPALVALLPALHHAGVAWVYVKSQALIKSALRHLRALDGTASCAAPADTAEHRPGAHAAQPPTCMATTTATPPDPAASASADTLTAAQRRMAELRVADEPSSGGGVKNGACVHACCGDGLGPGEGSGTDVAIEIEERRKAEPAVSPAAAEPRPGEASDPAERSAGSAAAAEAAVSATAAAAASNASKGPGGATAQAKRSKLKASPMRHTPERVLWRWCNHNMPKAWDLDLELPEDSGGGGVLSREGLAIVLDSGEWWRQMVSQATPQKYPLDYPIRHTADGHKICRYHNYGTCKKHEFSECPLDHDHCHACGARGHTAHNCDLRIAAFDDLRQDAPP